MKKSIFKITLLAALTCTLFVACSENEEPTSNPPETEKANYMLITSVDAGGGQSFGYYLQNINSLTGKNKYTNSAAFEMFSNGYAGVFNYKNNIFINQYIPEQSIIKWEADTKGNYSKAGEISIPELGFQGNICFKDDNIAFVAGVGNNIVIFNPTTMIKTGTIDLSGISRVGEVTNYPNPGDKVNMEVITDLIIRDNQLFVAVGYINDLNSYIPASLTADFIVIDLTKVDVNTANTASVVLNTTSSDKGVAIGGWNSGWGAPFMKIDEKDDLYVLCHNFWGGTKTGKKTCLLRVKKGETTFDDSYYFDLETASKGAGNPVLNFNYYKDGVFFGIANDLSKLDPSNPWSYYIDELAQWYKFDIYKQTATLVSDTYSKGNFAAKVYFENGNAYIPYDTKEKSFVNEVRIATLKAKTIFETEGVSEIIKIQN